MMSPSATTTPEPTATTRHNIIKKQRSSELQMLTAMDRSDQVLRNRRHRMTAPRPSQILDESPILPHRLLESSPEEDDEGGDDDHAGDSRSTRTSRRRNNKEAEDEEEEEQQEEDHGQEQQQDDCSLSSSSSSSTSSSCSGDDEQVNNTKDNNHKKAAMPPVNILIPYKELCCTLEQSFKCPKCNKKKLNVSQETYGFATELFITCDNCNHSVAITPIQGLRSKNKNNKKNDDDDEDDDEEDNNVTAGGKFMDYAINYSMSLLMQQLGMGLRGVTTLLSFLGIAAGIGNPHKWKRIQDEVGLAEEAVAADVVNDNIRVEVEATKEAAQEAYQQWLSTTDEGRSAGAQDRANKLNELLRTQVGYHDNKLKIGLTVGMDGAWQKRSIGRGTYNSKTGHNFAIGGYTKKIISIVAYSKHCFTCDRATKLGIDAPIHRCARNYDADRSSKAMEPLAAVDHCKYLANKQEDNLQCYIHQLITDDDSTTRANTKHSYRALADRDYPGWTQKKNTDWPFKLDRRGGRVYLPDHGKLPLWVPEINSYLCDISHRIKVIGSAVYALNSASNVHRIKSGWTKYDAERIKFNAGYFFHQEENQQLPFQQFCMKAKCIYLHHFNDHCCCDKRWCRVLRSQQEPEYDLPAAYKADERFREKQSEEGKLVFKKVEAALASHLSKEALAQVHHKFSTQKNESLNRKMTAVAPKDRHYGGTSSLKDRVNLVAIQDSVGFEETLRRLFHVIGLPLTWNSVLFEWAKRKDGTLEYLTAYWKKPSNKRKRAETRFECFKAGKDQDKRAKRDGTYYKSGIAMDHVDDTTTTT